MTDIRDNPPPLMDEEINEMWVMTEHPRVHNFARQIEAAAFERGKAAMQGEVERLDALHQALSYDRDMLAAELDELRAKLKELKEPQGHCCYGGMRSRQDCASCAKWVGAKP